MVRQNKSINRDVFSCHDHIEFGKYGEEHGVWAVFKCQKKVKAMNDCLNKW
jgi:hypothetical protein